jgi:hypothetical protein
MPRCAYCEKECKVTKEEVLPLFLSRDRPTYRTVVDHHRQLVRQGIVAPFKDVCGDCNGIILSELDSNAARLDREYFNKIVGFSPDVEFKYDYKKLLRWLLKISYNDDRTRSPPFDTRPYIHFILGQNDEPFSPTTILLGIITPGVTTPEQQARGLPSVVQPESCGVGYMGYDEPAKKDIVFSRFVQINSYFLNTIGWRSSVSRQVRRRHVAKICQIHNLFELRQGETSVVISAGTMNYLAFQAKFFDPVLSYRDIRRKPGD